ncbi:hypothetical protein BRC94_10565 [Halobacteriales archaeon QS_5_70_17]|nr:MAG: hypothetical protein BRC94_10565 [Halobacteriales archaeon QS_5_70_17]
MVVGAAVLGTGVVFGTDFGSDTADSALGEENPTPYESDEESSDGADGESDESNQQYRFTVDQIEKCGETCRDVTATLENTGEEPRSDVVVETRIYADSDLLWQGNSTAGDLPPGESYTTTERVELGYRDAMAVERNDGYITIQTIVHSAEGRKVYEERRKVA